MEEVQREPETRQLRHVERALAKMRGKYVDEHPIEVFIKAITPENSIEKKVLVQFQIQSELISMVGVDGCQAVDMLEYIKNLFISLNESFPCRENSLTITKIEEAIHWQDARTKDRLQRGVEGKNLK